MDQHFKIDSKARHIVIPSIKPTDGACLAAFKALTLEDTPHLFELLSHARMVGASTGSETDYTPLPEMLLANALGLVAPADGLLPWGSLDAHRLQYAHANQGGWAHAIPCHLEAGLDSIRMQPLRLLSLSHEEAHVLRLDLNAHLEDLKVMNAKLYPNNSNKPTRWLIHAPLFAQTPTASITRVQGASILDWLSLTPQMRDLRILHNEIGVFLTQHPINQQRADKGLPTINALWFCGSGVLEKMPPPIDPIQGLSLGPSTNLAAADFDGDATTWLAQLKALDQTLFKELLAIPCRLTLCGENEAKTWESTPLTASATWNKLGKWLGQKMNPRFKANKSLADFL